jgi:hypothetical protein
MKHRCPRAFVLAPLYPEGASSFPNSYPAGQPPPGCVAICLSVRHICTILAQKFLFGQLDFGYNQVIKRLEILWPTNTKKHP